MKEHCETSGTGNESCCASSGGSCGPASQSCSCGSGEPAGSCSCESACGDPVDKAIGSWIGAFFEAKRQVEVDLLKAKIQKAWGARLEKSADAILETVEAIWKATLSKAEAKTKLKERLRAILLEGQK